MKTSWRIFFAVLTAILATGCSAPTTGSDIRLLQERGFTNVQATIRDATYADKFYAYAGTCRVLVTKGKPDGRLYVPLDPSAEDPLVALTDPTVDQLRQIPAYAPCFKR